MVGGGRGGVGADQKSCRRGPRHVDVLEALPATDNVDTSASENNALPPHATDNVGNNSSDDNNALSSHATSVRNYAKRKTDYRYA